MEYEYKDTIYEFPDDMDPKEALNLIRKQRGESESGPAAPQKPAEAAESSAYDKYGVTGAIAPRTMSALEKGAGIGSQIAAAAGDVLTIPQRAVAAGATLAGFNSQAGADVPYSEGLKEAARSASQYKPAEDTKGFQRFAEEVAYDPMLVPGLATGATEARLATKLPGLLKAAVPAASGALQAAGSSAIRQATEEGEINPAETGVAAGVGAAVPLVASGVSSTVKKVAESSGKRLIQALIRPGQAGAKQGFDIDYIMKDKELLSAASGGIEDLQAALKGKFNGLAGEVRQIQKAAGQDVSVDVPSVFMRTARKLKASDEFTGMKRELLDAITDLQDNLDNDVESFDELTDLATAMKLRTNYGTIVKWTPGISGSGRKAANTAGAEEKVYDAFYKELSDEIKKKAEKGGLDIAGIDKEFSKLIPALKAVNRRVLVETSNLPIGLMESVGAAAGGGVLGGTAAAMTGEGDLMDRLKRGLIGAAGGAVAAKISKSPMTGRALYGIGQNIPSSISGGASMRFINPYLPTTDEQNAPDLSAIGNTMFRR